MCKEKPEKKEAAAWGRAVGAQIGRKELDPQEAVTALLRVQTGDF
jgi:hypothetical protein